MENAITPEIDKQVMLDIYAMPDYRKLLEKQREFMKAGLYANAIVIGQRMEKIKERVYLEIAKKYISSEAYANQVIASFSEEERREMTILANALYLMSDTLDSMVMEIHSILKKRGLDEDSHFDKLSTVLKESKKAVYRFDMLLSDDYASKLAGDMSDSMYKLVYNKASSFSKKLKDYAERADKKAARNAKVA